MAGKSNLVNLDAMIRRADFAVGPDGSSASFERIGTISVRDFTQKGLVFHNLRKPDFQRETNHWTPEQVVSLLECFVSGDLIPSVILWPSPTHIFVIDGGHRLSVLRAWIEDDYGDGPVSVAFFGTAIPETQRRAAKLTRDLVNQRIGTWQHLASQMSTEELPTELRRKVNIVASRGLPIQWVEGDAEKAEGSFFKINTKGTPLDDIEELLLTNRRKAIAIASRAVIRAGMGHKYWSGFSKEIQTSIEATAKELHRTLFEPEVDTPVKTLDLPLGGSTGVRAAIQVLIDFILAANRDQQGQPAHIASEVEDSDGTKTLLRLEKALRLAKRITGNDSGSLGLHPAVYFYGPTGRHVGPLFMGTVTLVARKLADNDKTFFPKFTKVRERLEQILVHNKDLLATVLQKSISRNRVNQYALLLERAIEALSVGNEVTEATLVDFANLTGKVVTGTEITKGAKFSDEAKSITFLKAALSAAIKCPICNGYLDPSKSVSYDHVERVRNGGVGNAENCQLTHPYCNQSIKN